MVISGPSGSGKSTLVKRVLDRMAPRVRLSVSATTRAPRAGECEGVEYHFLTREQFRDAVEHGDFLECAEFAGNRYGTPWAELERPAECVLLEIEVQGALQVRARKPEALLVWIDVPSVEVLERRLRERRTESPEALERRLAQARWELGQAHLYDRRILNDDLDRAAGALVDLLNQYVRGEIDARCSTS
jgi:guanylate kinase